MRVTRLAALENSHSLIMEPKRGCEAEQCLGWPGADGALVLSLAGSAEET